jgi:hypothetical protein
MTDSPKIVSDGIANTPADAPVSEPKTPADGAKPAEAAPSEQKPVAKPDPLKTLGQSANSVSQ